MGQEQGYGAVDADRLVLSDEEGEGDDVGHHALHASKHRTADQVPKPYTLNACVAYVKTPPGNACVQMPHG